MSHNTFFLLTVKTSAFYAIETVSFINSLGDR